MTWYEMIINLCIGILGGIISTLVTSGIVLRKIKRSDEYKDKLLESYLFFKKLEVNNNTISNDIVLNKLVDYRALYSRNPELNRLFRNVDIGISHSLCLGISNGTNNYTFLNDDYLSFIDYLERKLQMYEK